MYIPAHFRADDPDILLELMQNHAFACLLSAGARADVGERTGFAPAISHLPFLVERRAQQFVLTCHLAKANTHWQILDEQPDAVVIFQGPHTYVSPSLYQSALQVPTWNYMVVHAYGKARIINDAPQKLDILQRLVADNEPEYAAQMAQLPQKEMTAMLNAIVGIEIVVDKLESKFKLSQHRVAGEKPEMRLTHEQGNADQQEIAAWMKRLGFWQ